MEVQMCGSLAAIGPGPARAPVKTFENGPRRSESFRTSATRSLHTASGASRPVMTAPPTTTVSDI